MEQLLRPDGTIDLDSGYRGSVSVAGWQMLAGKDGSPRFVRRGEEDPLQEKVSGASPALSVPADSSWDARFGGLGTDGAVKALLADGYGNMYIGGDFVVVGNGVTVNHVAEWNGSGWFPVGTGTNGSVQALAFMQGSLIAGGQFTTAGGVSANHIAKWNGTTWSPLGSGTNDWVNALAVFGGSTLYAGGWFTNAGGVNAYRVAKWNGTSWSSLGSGMNDAVFALALNASGNLYAGGQFTTAGGVSARYIAKWNGSTWADINFGYLNNAVSALAVSTTGLLYAGGSFTGEENYVGVWNGSYWAPLGTGTDAPVSTLALDAGGNLYAGGDFANAGGIAASRVAKWDGTRWLALGPGFGSGYSGWVNAVAVDSHGNLYAGGGFTNSGGVSAHNLSMWNGSCWSGDLGSDGWLYAVAMDGSGNVYVGGTFSHMGNQAVNNVAKWNGTSWSAMGSGITGSSRHVDAIAVAGGLVYVGGLFSTAGGVPASNIAAWNGSSWAPLGSGTDGYVYALASDGSGNLYVGGSFSHAGGISTGGIARWNGTTWSTMGGLGPVYALAVDGSGNVYAGGTFGDHVAKWNGSSWQTLDGGTDGPVYALAVDPVGDLYAGGNFRYAGGVDAPFLARWDGGQWWWTGYWSWNVGWSHDIRAIAIDPAGTVFVGGDLRLTVDGVGVGYIAERTYDGTWYQLGSDTNDIVEALAVDSYGRLHVGGLFTQAGSKPSFYFGTWHYPVPPHFGACCLLNGTCTLMLERDCYGSDRVWHGEWTTCSPNPCPPPLGACCNPATGECQLTLQGDCHAPNGWHGEWTTCTPNPCPPPLGACCDPSTGRCQVTSQAECVAPDVWHGEWTTCTPNPCPPPTEIVVYADGSGVFPTIQEALDAVAPNGTVFLAPGTFRGTGNRDLDFHGKPIVVRSQGDDPGSCVIDCEATPRDPYRAFYFHSGEDSTSAVAGITMMNGAGYHESAYFLGGGIFCDGTNSPASPRIIHCVFRTNHSDHGSAIYVFRSSPVIQDCVFMDNSSWGTVWVEESTLKIDSCTFFANSTTDNSASAVMSKTSAVTLSQCILSFGGGGPAADCLADGNVALDCSDVYGNAGGDWVGCIAGQDSLRNNLSDDPLFCSYELRDLRVRSDSPCAPEHNPSCGLIGALPAGGCSPAPDLVVSGCDPDTVLSGAPVTLTVTVKNRGTAAAPATMTRVRVDGVVKCDQIDTPALGAGEAAQVYCAFASLPVGTHTVEVRVDATDLVAESYEGNNLWTQPLVVRDVSGMDGTSQRWETALMSVTPNPSAGTTTIRYSLAEGNTARLEIFDASGRRVRVLGDGVGKPGLGSLVWDGRSQSGNRVAGGMYYLRFVAGQRTWRRGIVVLR